MKINIWGHDFGPFVLGKKTLSLFPSSHIRFFVQQQNDAQEGIEEKDFWETGIKDILQQKTRFGRIGIFYDRRNNFAAEFCQSLSSKTFPFLPKEVKRAEKTPRFSFFEYQVLHALANEGCADSVEFRRLARKYIRHAKHAHCDTLFFLEAIFGEGKTKDILQHLAGTQMKVYTVDDFFVPEKGSEEKTRTIEIHSEDDPDFTVDRAEKILQTKLPKTKGTH